MSKEQVAQLILDTLRRRQITPDQVYLVRWLTFDVLDKLAPHDTQQPNIDLVEGAIKYLVAEGLITEEKRIERVLILTAKGEKHIHSN